MKMPLQFYDPLRYGAVFFRRGSLPRKVCVALLKAVARSYHLAKIVPEIRPFDDSTVSFRSVDSMVMDAVYWFGIQGYKGKVADVWISLCENSRSILEIGGNVGLFTVIGARATRGTYTVVEPVPEVTAILRDNLRQVTAPDFRLIRKDVVHEITHLTDGEFWCVYAHRTPRGEFSQEFNGWMSSYV